MSLYAWSNLESTNVPAVKAVLGQEGIVEGIDYRGVPVVAYLCAIPNSPWSMVTRMDLAEVYAPLRERLWLTVLLLGAWASVGLSDVSGASITTASGIRRRSRCGKNSYLPNHY